MPPCPSVTLPACSLAAMCGWAIGERSPGGQSSLRSHDPCLLTHKGPASSWGPMESHEWWQGLAVGGAWAAAFPASGLRLPIVPLPAIKYHKAHLHRV